MYNDDDDPFIKNDDDDLKCNIPNDLPNINIVGDAADREKTIKIKLNKQRVKDIFEELTKKNYI